MKTDVSIPTLKMLKGLSEESTIADLKDSLRVAGYGYPDYEATDPDCRPGEVYGSVASVLASMRLVLAARDSKQKEEGRSLHG